MAVNSVSDRLSTLQMDVQANAAKSEAGDEKLSAELDMVTRNLAKATRQIDSDREGWSSCAVALEKRLAEKAAKVDTEVIGSRVAATEALVSPLPQAIATKATNEELSRVKARTDALEASFPKKADSSVA